eukprot:11184550-Ditylum_brightwellii.AAC.1
MQMRELKQTVKCPGHLTKNSRASHMQQQMRNHQEMPNDKLKLGDILHVMYHYDIAKYGNVVCAVAVIVQVAINNGKPTFLIVVIKAFLFWNNLKY